MTKKIVSFNIFLCLYNIKNICAYNCKKTNPEMLHSAANIWKYNSHIISSKANKTKEKRVKWFSVRFFFSFWVHNRKQNTAVSIFFFQFRLHMENWTQVVQLHQRTKARGWKVMDFQQFINFYPI